MIGGEARSVGDCTGKEMVTEWVAVTGRRDGALGDCVGEGKVAWMRWLVIV